MKLFANSMDPHAISAIRLDLLWILGFLHIVEEVDQ
jgi:hypothetical protein